MDFQGSWIIWEKGMEAAREGKVSVYWSIIQSILILVAVGALVYYYAL